MKTATPLGKRILVCDDCCVIAMGWAMMLSDAGYQVVGPVHAADKALEEAQKSPPDLALLDIGLNGAVDGISLATELVALGVPVIFVTGDYHRATTEGRGLASDILLKPVRPSDLMNSVSAVIERGSCRVLG